MPAYGARSCRGIARWRRVVEHPLELEGVLPGGALRLGNGSTRDGRVEVVQGGSRGTGARNGPLRVIGRGRRQIRQVAREDDRHGARGVAGRGIALRGGIDRCARVMRTWLLLAPLKIIVHALTFPGGTVDPIPLRTFGGDR